MSLCVNLYICTLAIPEEKSCEILQFYLWFKNLMVLQIEVGSTNVRIGSTIFGAREYPKKESQ